MKIKTVALLAACLFLLASGCARAPEQTNLKPLVAVSILPEQAFVNAVCGDAVRVIAMIPPGSSPETYEPSAGEMALFEDAAIYFTVGVPAEDVAILPGVSDKTKVIALEDEAAEVYPERTIDGGRDPHIWLSPKRAIVMVRAVAREMAALIPEQKDLFDQNAEDYIAQIERADAHIRAALEGVEELSFIVYHPAFGYFADEYGLTMYALESEGKEATAKGVEEMVDIARENGIKAIFYQAETDASQARAFAEEIGGRAVMLEPLSEDYVNNLETMADALAEAMN